MITEENDDKNESCENKEDSEYKFLSPEVSNQLKSTALMISQVQESLLPFLNNIQEMQRMTIEPYRHLQEQMSAIVNASLLPSVIYTQNVTKWLSSNLVSYSNTLSNLMQSYIFPVIDFQKPIMEMIQRINPELFMTV